MVHLVVGNLGGPSTLSLLVDDCQDIEVNKKSDSLNGSLSLLDSGGGKSSRKHSDEFWREKMAA